MSMSDVGGGAPPKRHRTQEGEELVASSIRQSSIAEGMAQLEERIASLQSHVEQATREATDVQELFKTTVAAQTPFLAQKWPGVLSALSSAADGLRGIDGGVKGTCRPIGWAEPPPPRHLSDDLSADLWRDVIYPMLSADEAVCSARPTSKTHGSQLVDETFMLTRIDKDLKKYSLTGLIDVERPTPPIHTTPTPTPTAADTDPPGGTPTYPQPASDAVTPAERIRLFRYLSASAYALERGGELLRQQMADFINLARNYKLIKTLPLRLAADWMAEHLPSKTAFDELPLALAVYKTFGHMLSCQGDSLALRRVDEQDDENENESENDQDSDSDLEDDDMGDERGDEEQDDDTDQHQQEGQGGQPNDADGQQQGGGNAEISEEQGDDAMGDGSEQDEGDNEAAVQQQQEGAGGDGAGGQPGDGSGGGVTSQRYRIGTVRFTTVPLTGLPLTHPYRSTYDHSDPVVRSGGSLLPSFTEILKRTVLRRWYDVTAGGMGAEGVEEKLVRSVDVGRDDSRYQSLMTARSIEGCKTVDIIDEDRFGLGDGGRLRLIILKGTAANDTIAVHLWVANGIINLWTTEATDIERHPVAVAAARPLLGKYGLERTVLR
ncbi:unnamed protein product [Vitrella brassicaformis CCMP3155]|uniref:Uncharacterized protein n=1 Tax=Vitrella brassicaformis (strain CCMP3155) TaxID=1169540 RepID=A0A0G4EVW4_VITBC|nr:unnamed protein product [Vitrella brassicaformis CCMP3155]|eukprot:CEM02572.1 unnamed protein product [Vitrella brassicaformis CCMP3155]